MCSADALEEDVQVARAAGFGNYWTKPVDFNKDYISTTVGRVIAPDRDHHSELMTLERC